MEELEKLFEPMPASVEISEKNSVVESGENASFICHFTGVSPWNLIYSVNGVEQKLDSIMENPYIVTVPTVTAQTSILPVAISNRTTESGEVAGKAEIFIGKQAISPTFDTYVHQANKTTAYVDDDHLEVKGNSDTHTREAYLSFPIDKIDPEANRIVLRAYYYDCIYPSWVRKETHPVGIAGNTQQYTTMTWDNETHRFHYHRRNESFGQ